MKNKITLIDGAMGTEIRARGCEVPSHHSSIWSAKALIDNPDVVKEIHKDYILAGADIIVTNNYEVTHNLLKRENIKHKLIPISENDFTFENKKFSFHFMTSTNGEKKVKMSSGNRVLLGIKVK